MHRESVCSPTPDLRYSGVRALWLKVILRAIFDWITYRDSTKLMQRKLAENAQSWLFKPNCLFNSFENICKYLDVDVDTVRDRASHMTRCDIAKIEFLEREGDGLCECEQAVLELGDGIDSDEVN